MKWRPKDIIACLIVVVAAALLFTGIDTVVGWTLIAVICGYYGIDLAPFLKTGRDQTKKEEE